MKLKNIDWAKIIAASKIKMYLVRADRANRENYFFLQLYSLIVMYAFSRFSLAIFLFTKLCAIFNEQSFIGFYILLFKI